MKIGMSLDFLEQLMRLTRQDQKRVQDFLPKFMNNPKGPGINWEVIHATGRTRLHSVRFSQELRGIVGEIGDDGCTLLHVDHHDAAYAWARGRRCEIHPKTGALQVYSVPEVEFEYETDRDAPFNLENQKIPGRFDPFSDKELLRIGVPEDLIPVLRRITSDSEFDALLPSFPAEISDPLFLIATGASFQEVLEHLEYTAEPGPVDTSNASAALERAESRKQFTVVENERELAEMMNASLDRWRIFLHPTQRKLVERDWNGPVRVLGGAGTGKTVAAMHRVRWLLEKRVQSRDERILFTTFTVNLAEDISHNLKRLIPAAMEQVEVINLDRWANRYAKEHRLGFAVQLEGEHSEAWKSALSEREEGLDVSDRFLREEWEQIIQGNGVQSEAEYLKTRRTGRGTSLSGTQKKLAWKVFATYRRRMEELGKLEPDEAFLRVTRHIEGSTVRPRYHALVVDETQDMGAPALRLLRSIAGAERVNDIFLVGDPFQRIYDRQARLGACGISIRGRGRKLRVNYRTTEEIRRAAVARLEGTSPDDLDEGTDTTYGGHSLMHGPQPELLNAPDFRSECELILKHLRQRKDEGNPDESLCIVARTKDYCGQIVSWLESNGIQIKHLDRNSDSDEGTGIRIATMHRVKGLEFDAVIVSGLRPELWPMPSPTGMDAVSQRRWQERERALLYVAMTRARKEVLLVGASTSS